MEAESSSANRQIARAAGTVMLAFVLSNLMGLLRSILVAKAFGTSLAMEAFTPANRVSETLFNLVAGGALGSAFIPTFTSLLAKEQRESAWRLASAICNLILVILTLAAAVSAVFAPQVVRYLLASGFTSDPLKYNLTVSLLRLMLPSAVIFGVSGLVMAVLNSHQVFLVPALTPTMYSLGIIFGAEVLAPRLGIYGLAWGVLIGATLHLALQLPALFRLRGRYSPTLGLKLEPVREVARLMGPRLFGVAVVQLNFWVNNQLASLQPEGSVNGIAYAFTLMLMPQAAIAQSIAIAAMPTFSLQVARGKLDEMRLSLAASLRGVLLLSIPASLGLIILRKPLIAALYQRGEFTSRSTELVAWALLWYAAGLVGHSVVEILARAFYSLHDTRTPVLVGAAAMGLNVLFSVAFSAWFNRLGWAPHGGLALANSLATALEMIGLLVLMRRRLGGLDGKNLFQGLAQAILGGGIMSLALWGWLAWTSQQSNITILAGGLGIGVCIYGLMIGLLRIDDAKRLVGSIKSRYLAWKSPGESTGSTPEEPDQ